MNDYLNFKLISWGDYSFTVNDLIVIVSIFVVSSVFMFVIRKIVNRRFRHDEEKDGRRYAIIKLVSYFVWTIAILLMVNAAGVKITLLLAGSAALLVGIGLGLQQTFNDFISGFILLIDRTIEVNDVIEIEGMIARVESIGIRTSTLVTRDDIVFIVPNSRITGNNVINWSHTKKQSRFNISIGVAYGSDEELVRKVLLECTYDQSQILKDPAPFVRLEDFGNSSVKFCIYFWTSEVFRVENIKSDLRFLIVKKLRENNITIPFPQMDVYVKKLPERNL